MKDANPDLLLGFVGAKVAVEPERSLMASPAIDFVGREEFDFTVAEIADGRPLAEVLGVSYRTPAGTVAHNPDRLILRTWTASPS